MLLCMFEGLNMFFGGVDCIVEKVTFEQRCEESSKELSGEGNRARRSCRGTVPGAFAEQPGDPVVGPGASPGEHREGPPLVGWWVFLRLHFTLGSG